MTTADFKNIKKHNTLGVVYPQATHKNGTTWILRQNGESLTVPTDELEDVGQEFLLARYVNKKFNIMDASFLCVISLKKIAIEMLKKEKNVEGTLEIGRASCRERV